MADLSEYIGMDWDELARNLGWLQSMSDDILPETATPVTKVEHDGMKLQKSDMPLYGLCPARDEFFLVVCEKCGQLVKPHAFQHHIVIRHESGKGNVTIGRPPVAQSLQVYTARKVALPSTCGPNDRPPSSKFRDKPAKPPSISKKNRKGRPVRGGHRSLAQAGILAVDSDRTKVNASLESQIPLRLTDNQKNDDSSQIVTNMNPSSELSRQSISTRDSPIVLQSTVSPVSDTVGVVNHSFSLPVAMGVDSPPKVLPAIAVKTQPLVDQSWAMSSPNNCDIPPPTLEVCTDEISSSASLNDTRQCSSSNKTLPLKRLVKDSVSSMHENKHFVAFQSTTAKQNVAAVVELSESKCPSQVVSNAESTTLPSLSMPLVHSKKPAAFINAVLKMPVNLLPSKVKKSSGPAKFILCKDREFDANKHCGVWLTDVQKPCTRSLTCKTHSRSLRRAVAGRSKQFDVLLQEQRERRHNTLCREKQLLNTVISSPPSTLPRHTILSETARTPSSLISGGMIRHVHPALAGSAGTVQTIQPLSARSSAATGETFKPISQQSSVPTIASSRSVGLASICSTGLGSGRSMSQLLVNNSGALRVGITAPSSIKRSLSLDGSTVSPVAVRSLIKSDQVKAEPVVISDDEEDGAKNDLKPLAATVSLGSSLPKLTSHPRPLAVNGFGSWLHGDGCYVFNRSSDVCRAALVSALERSLQPPPHKKLCVESNLKLEAVNDASVSEVTDPYEFASIGAMPTSHSASDQSSVVLSETQHSKPETILNSNSRRLSDVTEPASQGDDLPQSLSTALVQSVNQTKEIAVPSGIKLTAGPWLVKSQASTAFNGRILNLPLVQSQQALLSHTVTIVQTSQPGINMMATSQPVSFIRSSSQPVSHTGAVQQRGLIGTSQPVGFRAVSQPVTHLGAVQQQRSVIGTSQAVSLLGTSQMVSHVGAVQPQRGLLGTTQTVGLLGSSQPVTHLGAVQQQRGLIGTSQAVSLLGTSQRATFTLQPVRPSRAVANNVLAAKTMLPVSLTVAASPVILPSTSISTPHAIRPMSSATMPNGSFSRVHKPAGSFSSDGGLEVITNRQQSVATLLSLDKKPVIAPSSAPIGILLAAPIVTTWQIPAGDKDGVHRVISQLPGHVTNSPSRVVNTSTSPQCSQLSYLGQPCTVVDRRPMILSKLRINQGSGLSVVGDIGGSCGQNSSVVTMPSKLLLHSVGGSVADTAAHMHHQRKVSHQTAASSGADSNVLS